MKKKRLRIPITKQLEELAERKGDPREPYGTFLNINEGPTVVYVIPKDALAYPEAYEVFDLVLDGDRHQNYPGPYRFGGHDANPLKGIHQAKFRLVPAVYEASCDWAAVIRTLSGYGTIPETQWLHAFAAKFARPDVNRLVAVADDQWMVPAHWGETTIHFPYIRGGLVSFCPRQGVVVAPPGGFHWLVKAPEE